MSATELIEHLLAGTGPSEAHPRSQSPFKRAASDIIHILLAEDPVTEPTPPAEIPLLLV